jgi:hypothetical protein
MDNFSVAKLIQVAGLSGKYQSFVNLTSNFLADPDKEGWFKNEGKQPDKQLLDQFVLADELFPIENSDDLSVLQFLFNESHSIGSVVASGGEIPTTKAGELITKQGNTLKMALSHEYKEDDRLQMYQLSRMANLPTGLIEMLFGTTKNLMNRLTKLANVLSFQALYRGMIDFTDPKTRIRVQLDYKPLSQLFPAPLTGGDVWTNPTTGNAIETIRALSDRFYHVHGYYPEMVILSQKAIRAALAQQSTINSAASIGIIYTAPTVGYSGHLTLSKLNQLLVDNGLPQVRQWDAQYELEVAPGITQRGRYIPDDIMVFAEMNMGKRIFAPTIASINDRAPKGGLHQRYVIDQRTLSEANIVEGRFFPLIKDTRKLAAQKIF